jgi:hypothetical protein
MLVEFSYAPAHGGGIRDRPRLVSVKFFCYSVFLFQFVLRDPKLIASWP